MAYVIVLPEFGLVADPMVGIITSAGESLSPVADKVTSLEASADDLINMLSGEGNYVASFPGREKTLTIGGSVSAFWYGLAIGLLIAGVIAFQLVKVG